MPSPTLLRFLISLTICALLTAFAASGLLAQLPFLNALIQLAMFAAAVFVGKRTFIRALGEVHNRRIGESFFSALASTFGAAFSLYEMFMIVFTERGAERLLFAPCVAVIAISMFSEYRTEKAKPAGGALNNLESLRPAKAAVLRDGAEITVSPNEICKGDIIAVRPGETIPCDGDIIAGRSDIDETVLTGELLPVCMSEGGHVSAGSVNLSGFLTVRADGENALEALISAYRAASRSEKRSLSRRITRISGLIALFASAVLFIICTLFGELDLAAFLFVAVFGVFCPCGLMLARLSADNAASRRGASDGLFLRDPSALANIGRADTVVIDRTGTATVGKLAVSEVVVLNDGLSEASVVRLAAALCANATGVDYSAITEYCLALDTAIPPCIAPERLPAKLTGIVDGQRVELSSLYEDTAPFLDGRQDLLDGEKVLRCVFCGDEAVGVIVLCDKLKPNAQAAVKALTERGMQTLLMTGGHGSDIVNETEDLGADGFVTELSASEKADFINDLRDNGKTVMMIGDGVSDCAALRAADFSFALSSGAEAAKNASSAVLLRNDLRDVIAAVELSESAERAEKLSLCVIAALRTTVFVISAALYALASARIGVFCATAGLLVSAAAPKVISFGVKRNR